MGMTNASNKHTPLGDAAQARLVDEVTEERFGPRPQRRPGVDGNRERFIATLHALIAWFVEHPDVPTPWSCSIGIHVTDAAELTRVAQLLELEPWPSVGSPESLHVFDPIGRDSSGGFYTPIAISVQHPDRPL